MIVDDKILEGMTAQAFNMARKDMEQGGGFSFLLAFHLGELRRMPELEGLIAHTFGVDWLNNPRAKDRAFEGLAKLVTVAQPPAVVTACIVNQFNPTDKLLALEYAEQRRMLNAGHDRHHEMVREGWLRCADALWAMAQSRERICHKMQEIHPRTFQFIGKAEGGFSDAKDFDGRMKLYL